ncbi:hypothetical protein CERSUDRAFT_92933 [Gelatoporia subvermispora B]|uniref:Uncharacterized protein n=1 Tax=Ceriporiopsis subvermispora (strain B) TaxID=914234 RepID=M2QPB7_CERS8|nr:hypothetical protein CERSUDRAFT_92933 [Gelatoporia subvermispora B]
MFPELRETNTEIDGSQQEAPEHSASGSHTCTGKVTVNNPGAENQEGREEENNDPDTTIGFVKSKLNT